MRPTLHNTLLCCGLLVVAGGFGGMATAAEPGSLRAIPGEVRMSLAAPRPKLVRLIRKSAKDGVDWADVVLETSEKWLVLELQAQTSATSLAHLAVSPAKEVPWPAEPATATITVKSQAGDTLLELPVNVER